MEPPWNLGTKVFSNGPGHMTKMATMTIYGKNLSKIFSGTTGPIAMKLGMWHWGLWPIIVCSNDDPGMTLTYFMPRSNLVTWAFLWEEVKNVSSEMQSTKWVNRFALVLEVKVIRCPWPKVNQIPKL